MANLDLTGTGVAIVTPFKKDGSIDFNALKKLVNHLVNGKVEYLVVMGTTGESVTLSKEEKQKVIDCVVKENKKRIPLVLGVGGNDTAEIAKQISKVDAKAFSAILSVSPYYNKPSQEGIYQHYKVISKASKLPIILYNVPGRTASNIAWDTTIRLAKEFKNIIAIKEASGSIEQCMRIINNRPKNFLVISGDDNLTLPIIASGGDGVISVVANAFPKDFSDMVRAAIEDDMAKARKLHYKLMDITDQLFADGNPGGIKYALSLMKICDTYLRLPLVEPNDKVKQKLKDLIKKY
ncbi:MAG: 4-hydroxy-tetrahydrodipicolinate synthase [Sphingobacteriaceae bacterium]|nr:4-hydroxy-tetrahydrodipicolinate synthase [Sphingobacteriaceae bacterium]